MAKRKTPISVDLIKDRESAAAKRAERAEEHRTRHRRRLTELGVTDLVTLHDTLEETLRVAIARAVEKLLPDCDDPFDWQGTEALIDGLLADPKYGVEEFLYPVLDIAEAAAYRAQEDAKEQAEKDTEEARKEARAEIEAEGPGRDAEALAASVLALFGLAADDDDSAAVRELRCAALRLGGVRYVDTWRARLAA